MREADLIVATGSGQVVRAAYSSGTPAYGVGQGNAVAIVAEDADVAQAANAVSIAIANKMTVEQLAQVDLLFQPNFSNPVNYIGSVSMKAAGLV